MSYISFQPSDYFNTKLYTGNSSTNAQTGIGFLPSWTWIKTRSHDGYVHVLVDAVRGVTKELRSSGTNAEITTTNSFTSFDSDGFTLGADSGDNYNKTGNTYVSWNWKANGQGSSNTDGTINSTYTSASTTSGFSIVKYTGNGSSGATVGHGLGSDVKMVMCKGLGDTYGWKVWHTNLASGKTLNLHNTNDENTDSNYISSANSTTFTTTGTYSVNESGSDYVAYCFAEKKGFSKIGKYRGNGSADGPFIFCGFKPAFVLFKEYTGAGDANWTIQDNKRVGYNPNNNRLYPNDTSAENTSSFRIDMLSNGFKLNNSDGDSNQDGNDFIYLAFADVPLVSSNGIPATAR